MGIDEQKPVVVLGAGVSGLRTAGLLSVRGIPVRVLESRDRLGGRALSEEVPGRADLGRFDLGPTWFWPQSEPLMNGLAKELELKTFAQYGRGSMVWERSASEPSRRHLLPEGAAEESLRFAGGVQALIEALAARIPRGSIETGRRAMRIAGKEDGTLDVEIEGGSVSINAGAVIVAMPPRLAARRIDFAPGLSEEIRRELMSKPTWMAGQAKVVAVYEDPFWREFGLSGMATSWAGPLQEIHDASPEQGSGALFGFFGMTARERIKLGEKEVLNRVNEQLIRLFGPSAANSVALLYKDWARDSDSSAEEDSEPLREYPMYGAIPELSDTRPPLFFAGTETSPHQGGHLEGALYSAERAAAEVLELFEK